MIKKFFKKDREKKLEQELKATRKVLKALIETVGVDRELIEKEIEYLIENSMINETHIPIDKLPYNEKTVLGTNRS